MMVDLKKLYSDRFDKRELEVKAGVWKVLVRDFFQQYVGKADAVLDIAAGDCEFINNLKCRRKYAIDLNPAVLKKADRTVNAAVCSCTNLDRFEDGSFDVVFASNIFEHLAGKKEVEAALKGIARVLKKGGRLLILQPNIKYAYGEYWDFFDHNVPLSHLSMVEAVRGAGLTITRVIPRFLPYSTKQSLPAHPLLVRIYLRLVFLQWLLGKQMFIAAKKAGTSG